MSEFQYHSLTQEEMDLAHAEEIHAREVERFHYHKNAQRYEQLLAEMGDLEEWPAHLVQHRGRSRDDLAHLLQTGVIAAQDHDRVFRLAHRDRLKHLLTTEAVELSRVEQYHALAVQAIPPERRALALERARAKRQGG